MRHEVHRLIKMLRWVLDRDGRLLWWWVLDEFDALFDVAFQALRASAKELLLLLGHALEDVDGLLGAVGLILMLTYHII